MSVLYLALPLALILAAVAVAAFVWTVNDGQLDDLETPAIRLLNDEEDGRQRESQTNEGSAAKPTEHSS